MEAPEISNGEIRYRNLTPFQLMQAHKQAAPATAKPTMSIGLEPHNLEEIRDFIIHGGKSK